MPIAIAQSLQDHCAGAAQVDKATLHIGAMALAKPQVHIHRFGSSLNGHVHFHVWHTAAPPWCHRRERTGIAILVCWPRIRRSGLRCPKCGGQMRLIAFITEGTQIRKILDHIGFDSELPQISPARGPPLWDDCDAQTDEGVHIEPDWDLAAQPAPDFDVDQRVSW